MPDHWSILQFPNTGPDEDDFDATDELFALDALLSDMTDVLSVS
jgi:hypothetical protein